MFFLASKIFGFVTLPSNAIALLCVAGVVMLVAGARRTGLRCLGAGVLLLLVLGYSPIGRILMLPLSERFPAWQSAGQAPDGIIVLGGAIDADATSARGQLEVDASAERIITMLRLARAFPKARIVFSGGSGNLMLDGVAEAPMAAALLEEFGIAAERITMEQRSRNTSENARFTRELVAPEQGQRWLLVTSAFHMPRAVGVFRQAGFEVEAYPIDWRSRGWSDAAMPFHRLSAGLARTDVAVHEWVGLLAYWLTGRTAELLPEP